MHSITQLVVVDPGKAIQGNSVFSLLTPVNLKSFNSFDNAVVEMEAPIGLTTMKPVLEN